MANRKVRMVRSVKVDGRWKFLSVARGRKLKIPNEEGRWYISWREGRRTQWKPAKDYGHAYELKVTKEAELHATAFGVKTVPSDPNRIRLEKAFDEFIEDQELLRRADKTVDAYRAVKRTFLKSCRVQFLHEVTRRDLLQYSEYLRKREGLSDRTVHTRWTALMTVLKHHNVRGLTKRGDAPQYVEEDAEAFLQTELDAIFKVMKPESDLCIYYPDDSDETFKVTPLEEEIESAPAPKSSALGYGGIVSQGWQPPAPKPAPQPIMCRYCKKNERKKYDADARCQSCIDLANSPVSAESITATQIADLLSAVKVVGA